MSLIKDLLSSLSLLPWTVLYLCLIVLLSDFLVHITQFFLYFWNLAL